MTTAAPPPRGESSRVADTPAPGSRESLATDLRMLGVQRGQVLVVHSSLAALGWVCGAEVAVVHALRDAVGPAGTLVVPSQSGDNSDPAGWQHPPVPPSWWPIIREQLPAYESAITPTRGMGRVADAVRHWPGAVRSAHPQTSLAALGPRAAEICHPHPLDCQLGEESPLGRLYDLDAQVLLLGVDHGSNTALHLAEYRVPGLPRCSHGCRVLRDGRSVWATYEDIDLDEEPFAALGEDFDGTGAVTLGWVGSARSRLMRVRPLVDFAVDWLGARRRPEITCPSPMRSLRR